MVGQLELEPVAAPDTVLESEGTGREGRARGFYFGDSGHGRRGLATAAAAATVAVAGNSWAA